LCIFSKPPDAIGQGVWALKTSSLCPYVGYLQNIGTSSNPADGDNCSFNFSLPLGTYNMNWHAIKGASSPKLDIYIDSTKILSAYDTYAGTTNWTNMGTPVAGLALGGNHVLKIQVNGKNASATSPYYYLALNMFTFVRTGD
jgi:hypothetical protein